MEREMLACSFLCDPHNYVIDVVRTVEQALLAQCLEILL